MKPTTKTEYDATIYSPTSDDIKYIYDYTVLYGSQGDDRPAKICDVENLQVADSSTGIIVRNVSCCGLSAKWAHVATTLQKESADGLEKLFNINTVPKCSVTFTKTVRAVTMKYKKNTGIYGVTYGAKTSEETTVDDFKLIVVPRKNDYYTAQVAIQDKTESNIFIPVNPFTNDKTNYYFIEIQIQSYAKSFYVSGTVSGGTADVTDDTEINLSGTLEEYTPESVNITVYGDKNSLSFEDVDFSSKNIENATTTISIQTNELLQNSSDVEFIRDNILEDYSNGVATATIDLFCGQKDWEHGEIIQPNDILTIEGESGYWRATGRTFRYDGSPTLSVELQEQTLVRVLSISKTDTTVTINRTSSPNHNASIGVITDKNFVYDGDVLSITVFPDNGCQLNTFTINRGTNYASGQTTAVTQTYTVDGDVSIVARSTATVPKYTLYILAGENTTVSVNRTSSQNPYASIGFITNRSAIYAGDSLSITVTANDGYKLSTFNINGESYLLGLDQTTARATYTVTSAVNIATAAEALPTYKETWAGQEQITSVVTTGDVGVSDGTNTWYTGSATRTLTVAGGYIQNSSYDTRITIMVDDTTSTYVLTSSKTEIASGTSALGNTKTRVYATLTSSGISIVTETQSTSANSKAISAVICYITKIEQYY